MYGPVEGHHEASDGPLAAKAVAKELFPSCPPAGAGDGAPLKD